MQRVISDIPFQFCGIGRLIKEGSLKIPPNNREYSWESKQVGELFEDFENAIRSRQPIYFLGTIVITKKPIPEVVDGQQRLATTTMIIASIRDYYYNRNEKDLADSVDQDYLFKYVRRDVYKEAKLTLNYEDNEYFRKRVISLPDSEERKSLPSAADLKKESHKKIDYAANRAERLIQQLTANQSDFRNIKSILEDWLEFIDRNAYIILLTVPDESNAYLMFETLNDRGLKTSQADLVKNHLFQEAGARSPEAQQKWSKMVSVLETLGDDDIVLTYLRHLVITLYGPTREKDIFERIKAKVSGCAPAITFLDKLADYADSYAAVLTPSHSKWNTYPNHMARSIQTLRELNVQQIRPLMLAVAQCFEPSEAGIAFRAFINWTVRFLIVGGMRGGQLEDAYGSVARDVNSQKIKTTKQLLDGLPSVPNDVDFQTEFTTAKVSKHNLARYFLHEIEDRIRKEKDWGETEPVHDTAIVNLEHILPEERSDNWKHIKPEMFESYSKRIGNLTLLKTKPNSVLKDAPFQVKRAEYKNSSLFITNGICLMTNEGTLWNIEEIDERQKKLAEIAVRTWPRYPNRK